VEIGPYGITGELGRGAMGVVYRGTSEALGRDVAIKVIAPDSEITPEIVDRFRREAQAAGRCSGHPGIVGVTDFGESDGRLWFAMELVDGTTLRDRIDEGELSPVQAAQWVREAALAVAHAHTLGVLHRDVKPDNILVDGHGHARVTDFGLSRITAADASVARLTRSDVILGTPAYMSPEQALGDPVDGRTDVWALGATLYEACTGRSPFERGDPLSVLMRVVRDDVPRPRLVAPGVPPALEAVILACLEKDVDRRYPSAAALAEDLERFLAGDAVTARGWTVGRTVRAAVRRHRLPAAMAAALLLAAGAGGTAWWLSRGDGGAGDRAVAHQASARAAQEQAAQISDAYDQLALRTLQPLAELAAAWRDEAALGAEAPQLRAVEAAADAVAAQHPETELPQAWKALARVFAGSGADANALDRSAQTDPMAALLALQLRLAVYAQTVELPGFRITETAFERYPFVEPAALGTRRAEARGIVTALRGHPAWPHVRQRRTYEAYLDGADALAEGAYARAADALAGPAGDPLLGADASALRGLCLYLAGDYRAAGELWDRLGQSGSQRAWARASTAWISAAVEVRNAGGDPRPLFDRALAAAGRVTQHRWLAARTNLGLIQLRRAMEAGINADGLPLAEEAVAAFDAVIAQGVDAGVAALNRGSALAMVARCHAALGRDPDPVLRRALADYDQAVLAAPRDAGVWNGRGNLHLAAARWAKSRNRDPEPALALAAADYDAALQAEPGFVAAAVNGADVLRERHEWRARRGPLGPTLLEEAQRRLDAVIAEHPGHFGALESRARLFTSRANHASGQGADGRRWVQRALQDYDHAIRLRPRFVQGYANRSFARLLAARFAVRAGDDPSAGYLGAIADAEALLELEPASPAGLGNRGLGLLGLADHTARAGADPTGRYEQARAAFDAVLRHNPRDVLGLLYRAQAHRKLALYLDARGTREPKRLAAALRDLDAAVALDAAQVQVRIERARVAVTLATWTRNVQGIKASVADFAAATTQVKRDPALYYDYLRVLIQLGRHDEAVRVSEEALTHLPGHPQLLAAQATAKRALEQRR
jgi:serine/threonine-protein kinase